MLIIQKFCNAALAKSTGASIRLRSGCVTVDIRHKCLITIREQVGKRNVGGGRGATTQIKIKNYLVIGITITLVEN